MNLNPVEVEECLRNMVYVVDSREQHTEALEKRLEYLQPYERETVNAGDYTAKTLLPDGKWFYLPVAVERKMSITEIAGNFCRERLDDVVCVRGRKKRALPGLVEFHEAKFLSLFYY